MDIDYKYNGKTNIFFTNGRTYKVTPEGLEHITEDDTNDTQHELSDDYLSKNFCKVFTQEMCDNGELPSAGMECLINFPDIDNAWYKYTIDFMGKHSSIATCEDVAERFGHVEDAYFKPLTPPIELIDGECYQFNSPSGGLFKGYYVPIKRLFVAHKGNFDSYRCTNIQPLTVEVK
tara:strand:+ start:745 stop:1272 length:528 start_codon:yes stop_codon:yes gene_type:complete